MLVDQIKFFQLFESKNDIDPWKEPNISMLFFSEFNPKLCAQEDKKKYSRKRKKSCKTNVRHYGINVSL